MTKDNSVDILVVFKWVFMAVALLALAWYAFSHSPTLEQIFTFVMTCVFFVLALESRHGTIEVKQKLEKLSVLDEIRDILKERLK